MWELSRPRFSKQNPQKIEDGEKKGGEDKVFFLKQAKVR